MRTDLVAMVAKHDSSLFVQQKVSNEKWILKGISHIKKHSPLMLESLCPWILRNVTHVFAFAALKREYESGFTVPLKEEGGRENSEEESGRHIASGKSKHGRTWTGSSWGDPDVIHSKRPYLASALSPGEDNHPAETSTPECANVYGH
jgi:hypothetical protein